MKIIFLKDVKNQGKKGEIKEVKDGYGMYLIKNKDAVQATSSGINRLRKEQAEEKLQENLRIKDCESMKEKLEKITLKIPVTTGKEDRVFGSVSSKQIITELKKLGYDIDKKAIQMVEGLSSLGVHQVKIALHKKVIATLKVQLIKK